MITKLWFSLAALCAAVLALGLAISPASATKLYICEMRSLGTQQQGDTPQVGLMPCVASQVVDFSGGVTASSAFSNATRFVRFWCDVQCSVKVGAAPTAANTDTPISALTVEYFGVTAGDKVSVITNP